MFWAVLQKDEKPCVCCTVCSRIGWKSFWHNVIRLCLVQVRMSVRLWKVPVAKEMVINLGVPFPKMFSETYFYSFSYALCEARKKAMEWSIDNHVNQQCTRGRSRLPVYWLSQVGSIPALRTAPLTVDAVNTSIGSTRFPWAGSHGEGWLVKDNMFKPGTQTPCMLKFWW